MSEDQVYQVQRIQLLAETIKMIVDKNWWGIHLPELAQVLNLSEWETQHLFQEYLQKEPTALIQDIFTPNKSSNQEQLSIFDAFDEPTPIQFAKAEIDLHPLSADPANISYQYYEHFLGRVCIADCEEGIVQITFEDEDPGMKRLVKHYPKSKLEQQTTELQALAFSQLLGMFQADFEPIVLPVTVKCSPFQEQVWNNLIRLEAGMQTTYGELAVSLGDKNASRAVGTAIGLNPVAMLIPCHRVVNMDGKVGHFRWGRWRKLAILGIEK